MIDKRDRTKIFIGTRLAALRSERGLTQADFCLEFAEFIGQSNVLIPTLSSWEQNHRIPTLDTIISLAQFYGVSVDYLLGITDERISTGSVKKQSDIKNIFSHSDTPIKKSDLKKFNGLPVYVKFKKEDHLPQWGILNCNTERISCKDFVVSLSADIECYAYALQLPVRTSITSYQQLLNTQYVWIEMISSDPEVSAKYNGRYTHNEDNSFLVNMCNGMLLRPEGLDTTFRAFRG